MWDTLGTVGRSVHHLVDDWLCSVILCPSTPQLLPCQFSYLLHYGLFLSFLVRLCTITICIIGVPSKTEVRVLTAWECSALHIGRSSQDTSWTCYWCDASSIPCSPILTCAPPGTFRPESKLYLCDRTSNTSWIFACETWSSRKMSKDDQETGWYSRNSCEPQTIASWFSKMVIYIYLMLI